MSKARIIDNASIAVEIPLTAPSGKIRVKTRSSIFNYGIPFASRQNNFSQMNYVEWQIGYDITLDGTENMAETSLGNLQFSAYNGKPKALYELSEYMFYMVRWGFFSKDELNALIKEIETTQESLLIENHPSCQIKRIHPKEIDINGLSFLESKIEYPLLIHRFGVYEIIAEIVVREKQRAIGTQAMLYFCFPITELKKSPLLIGRKAEKKETADFIFNKDNFRIIPEMIRIFGMLSKSHKSDIIAILKLIREEHLMLRELPD